MADNSGQIRAIPSMKSLVITCVLLYGVFGFSVSASEPRPNIVMILIDDLRPALGCYGDKTAKSPQIDQFAASARVFRRAYCHQAVCGPSRASILTGRLPDHTGVWHNRNLFRAIHPDLMTLPQLFRTRGWHSVSLGKVFSGDERELDPVSWSEPEVLKQQGWRNYFQRDSDRSSGKGFPYECLDVADDDYPDGKLALLAVDTLTRLKQQSQPFFLAVGFFKPHLPFNVPKRYWDLHDASTFENSPLSARTEGAPDIAYPDHLELAGYRSIPADERVSPEQARELRHGYYACVSYVDAQVGRVLDAIRQQELEHNTIVILVGDHGYSLGEVEHWCKDTNFELDTHIPLIIRVPGITPGPTEALVESVDLYPTLADLADLDPPADLDGRSLAAVLQDASCQGRNAVLSQFSRPFRSGNPEIMGYSLRTDRHRYTRWIEWGTSQLLSEELYDYSDSLSVRSQLPYLLEVKNLASSPEYSQLLTSMSGQLDHILNERVTPVTVNESMTRSRNKK
ncbi:MAG: sulfatase [Planctomycetota bacterium]